MDVATLIRSMSPALMPEVYVFITIQHNDTVPRMVHDRSNSIRYMAES